LAIGRTKKVSMVEMAIEHFGETRILDAIDKSTVMAHFGLEL